MRPEIGTATECIIMFHLEMVLCGPVFRTNVDLRDRTYQEVALTHIIEIMFPEQVLGVPIQALLRKNTTKYQSYLRRKHQNLEQLGSALIAQKLGI